MVIGDFVAPAHANLATVIVYVAVHASVFKADKGLSHNIAYGEKIDIHLSSIY